MPGPSRPSQVGSDRKKNLSLFPTTIQQLKWKSIPMSLILSLAKRLAAKNLKNPSAEKDLKEPATRRNLPKKSSVKQKGKLPLGHHMVQVQAVQTKEPSTTKLKLLKLKKSSVVNQRGMLLLIVQIQAI